MIPADNLEAITQKAASLIVSAAHPDRLILFGSAVLGRWGPDSDLDFLVIKADVPHRRKLAQEIYLRLFGLGTPVDIIVATPEDLEACRNVPGNVIAAALAEGKEIYARS